MGRSTQQGVSVAGRVAEWLAYVFLWCVAVGKVEPAELLFAAVAATLACRATATVRHACGERFALDFRVFAEAWRLPKYALTGTWEVLRVLARQLFRGEHAKSIFRTVRFETPENEAIAATRRALAIAYTTATPNFIVVGIDAKRGLMLYHQLEDTPVLAMTERLGARP